MNIEQEQIQFDIYYQGSQTQLYALLYPLSGPNSPIFQHFQQQKVSFQPATKHLTYTYSPQNFENIDKQKEDIKYTSKPVQNLSNYFYSTFHPDTECFVWRNLNRFLEMRPQNRVQQQEKNGEKAAGAKKNVDKSAKKEGSAQVIQEEPVIVQLEIVQSGQPGNIVEKQINQAPVTEVKPIWYCSKDQYFSYLAN